jgi:UDPglucose 6-dehydrogenase
MLAAETSGIDMPLQSGAEQENAAIVDTLLGSVRSHLPPGGTVGILGFAFKPDTHVTEESPSVLLAQKLIGDGVRVVGCDPEALENVRAEFGDRIGYRKDATDAVREADVVVITTPWEEFKSIPPSAFERPGRPLVVIDCWRLLANGGLEDSCRYIPFGMGPRPPVAAD